MEKMLAGLALQYEGQTKLSGADAPPDAPCTADHCEYLADGLAQDTRACSISSFLLFSRTLVKLDF
jgi:hypothetical protein